MNMNNRIYYFLILASPTYAILMLIGHGLNKHGHFLFAYVLSNLFTFGTLFALIMLALPNILLYAASKMTKTYALTIICISLSIIYTILNVLLLSASGGMGVPGLVILQMVTALLLVVIGGIVNIVKREGL